MTDVESLAALIRRVPVLRVDTRAAEPVERCAAASYARDMDKWLCEAASALVGIPPEGGRVESRRLGEHRPNGDPPSELVTSGIVARSADNEIIAGHAQVFKDVHFPVVSYQFHGKGSEAKCAKGHALEFAGLKKSTVDITADRDPEPMIRTVGDLSVKLGDDIIDVHGDAPLKEAAHTARPRPPVKCVDPGVAG